MTLMTINDYPRISLKSYTDPYPLIIYHINGYTLGRLVVDSYKNDLDNFMLSVFKLSSNIHMIPGILNRKNSRKITRVFYTYYFFNLYLR